MKIADILNQVILFLLADFSLQDSVGARARRVPKDRRQTLREISTSGNRKEVKRESSGDVLSK